MTQAPQSLLLLLSLFLTHPATADDAATEPRRLAVRSDSAELLGALKDGSFERWVLPNHPHLDLVTGPEASGDVEVLVQVPPSAEGLGTMLRGLPVRFEEGAFTLGETRYDDPALRLALRLPTAEKPTWLVSAFDTESAASMVDRVLMVASGVRFRRRQATGQDYLLLEHNFSERSGSWQKREDGTFEIDPDERDDLADRANFYAAQKLLKKKHITLKVSPERAADPALTALAARLDQAAEKMARRIPLRLEKPIEVIVEKDFESQGRHLNEIGAGVVRGDRLHVVFHPDDEDAIEYALARALVRRAGLDLSPWLEDGAALWLSEGWYGRPRGEWLPLFAKAQVLPSADELYASKRQGDSSDVLWPPAAAALVDVLEGDTLKDRLDPIPTIEVVRKKFTQVQIRAFNASPKPVQPAPREPEAFQNGISFAMANGLTVGYHAPGVDAQLARLRHLGANSVSLMPFAYQRSPSEPTLAFLNDHPSSETDVGVIHAARRAHARGFRVLWKPHIWVSHDSWPGDIAMTSTIDWIRWWHVYRRYIVHHAVLAEHTGSELFSIGVELGRTLEREAEWKQLIQAVRGVYSGELTYSGNWWGDYDRAPFWPLLDYVGVDAYFSLAHSADADRATLEEGARRAVEELRKNAERFGRPMLLTEVGFSAREGAWVDPHKEGGTFSEADQQLAYEVFLEALGRPPWLRGLYVWKVFSHADAEGGGRPDFRLMGRPAEAVVEGYFTNP